MPIHEFRYRDYEGLRTPISRRWLTIARTDLELILRRRLVWIILVAGLLPALAAIAFIFWESGLFADVLPDFLKINPGAQRSWHVDAGLFEFLLTHWSRELVLFALAFVAGAGRVANDVRTNAFLIYLSRPVRKLDYALGKFAAVASVLAAVSLLPALVALAFAWLLKPVAAAGAARGVAVAFDVDLKLSAAVVLFGLISCVYYAAAVLLTSAFAESAKGAAARFAALVWLSSAVDAMAGAALRTDRTILVSFMGNLEAVGGLLLGRPPLSDLSPYTSLAVVLGVILAGVMALEARIKAVEVVE